MVIHFVNGAFALLVMYALRLPASMQFFDWHPCQTTYFLPTAAKSKQKGPLANYVLHPIIFEI
jgi:hypothetical protein